MIYTVTEDIKYIPEWKNNRSKPESEQIKVYMSALSGADTSRFYSNLKLDEDGNFDKNDNNYYALDFELYVKKVENLKIKDKKGVRDATPRDIALTPGLSKLYTEIKLHYNKVTEVDPKN